MISTSEQLSFHQLFDSFAWTLRTFERFISSWSWRRTKRFLENQRIFSNVARNSPSTCSYSSFYSSFFSGFYSFPNAPLCKKWYIQHNCYMNHIPSNSYWNRNYWSIESLVWDIPLWVNRLKTGTRVLFFFFFFFFFLLFLLFLFFFLFYSINFCPKSLQSPSEFIQILISRFSNYLFQNTFLHHQSKFFACCRRSSIRKFGIRSDTGQFLTISFVFWFWRIWKRSGERRRRWNWRNWRFQEIRRIRILRIILILLKISRKIFRMDSQNLKYRFFFGSHQKDFFGFFLRLNRLSTRKRIGVKWIFDRSEISKMTLIFRTQTSITVHNNQKLPQCQLGKLICHFWKSFELISMTSKQK